MIYKRKIRTVNTEIIKRKNKKSHLVYGKHLSPGDIIYTSETSSTTYVIINPRNVYKHLTFPDPIKHWPDFSNTIGVFGVNLINGSIEEFQLDREYYIIRFSNSGRDIYNNKLKVAPATKCKNCGDYKYICAGECTK